MLLAVPVFALIYSLTRTAVENKLKKKKLPVSTAYYKDKQKKLNGNKEKQKPLTPEQLKQLDIPPIEEVNEAIDK